jgi:hypothetical protein
VRDIYSSLSYLIFKTTKQEKEITILFLLLPSLLLSLVLYSLPSKLPNIPISV